MYAKGNISDTAAFNLANALQPTPIPKEFYGWYGQAAYRIWEKGDQALTPFVRYERYNTASAYEALSAGLTPASPPTEAVFTTGVNYLLNPNVVFKADYQSFHVDSASDRLDLGLGLTF